MQSILKFGVAFLIVWAVSHSAAAQSWPRTPAPGMSEDFDESNVVDQDDQSAFNGYYELQDMRADVNKDGALTQLDVDQMAAAVVMRKRTRFNLPDAEGYEAIDVVQSKSRVLAIYRNSQANHTVYVIIPLGGRGGLPPGAAEILQLATGRVMALTYGEDGTILSVRYGDAGQLQEVPYASAELRMQIEVEEARARPLYPIGTCPSCVPMRYPSGWRPCTYLYSKWGIIGNCMIDVFGCSDTSDIEITVACCDEPGGNTPVCPD